MEHIDSFEYNMRKVDIHRARVEELRNSNSVYCVYVDGEYISDDHPTPGPTLDLVRKDVKEWIDNNPKKSPEVVTQ